MLNLIFIIPSYSALYDLLQNVMSLAAERVVLNIVNHTGFNLLKWYGAQIDVLVVVKTFAKWD